MRYRHTDFMNMQGPQNEGPFVLKSPIRHLAIIMDGNGRWATGKGLDRSAGHREGFNRVMEVVEECLRLGIKTVSLFAFSTENWKRPKTEIDFLFSNLERYLKKEKSRLKKDGIKVVISGDIEPFPNALKKAIREVLELSANHNKFTLNVCLNYGGQDEVVRAAKALAEDVEKGNVSAKQITQDRFESYLYSKGLSPIDVLIRTSGEQRVSNFMLYQMAYAEMIFTPTFWPDFTVRELHKCLIEYQARIRRFGGLK